MKKLFGLTLTASLAFSTGFASTPADSKKDAVTISAVETVDQVATVAVEQTIQFVCTAQVEINTAEAVSELPKVFSSERKERPVNEAKITIKRYIPPGWQRC